MIMVKAGGAVWTATIDAPYRRNALSRQMVADLIATIDRFENDTQARVLVLTGTGERAFCAGGDLKEMAAEDATRPFVPVMPALYSRLLRCRKVIVAVLNGDAVGGGLELALCCDIVIARRGARVGLPEVRLGTVARYGAALLARQIGPQPALALTMLAELRTVDDVPGIAAFVVDADELAETVDALAERLAALAPLAVAATKEVVRLSAETTLLALVERPIVLAAVGSADRRGAVRDFAGAAPPAPEKQPE